MKTHQPRTEKPLFKTGDWLDAVLKNPNKQPDQRHFETAKLRIEQPECGVLIITPLSGYKKNIVISAGIHGNETAPIEMLNGIVTAILADQLEVRSRLLLIIGHPPAAVAGRRFVQVNLNRLFSGGHRNHPDSYETLRAVALERIMTEFFQDQEDRFHYDLHTAIRPSLYEKFAISPFGQTLSPSMLSLLANCGIEAVLQNHQPATTFSFFSHAALAATAFTFELGKAAPFGQNPLELSAIHLHLAHQITDQPEPLRVPEPAIFRVVHELVRSSKQYRLNVGDATQNFTPFELNTLIETDGLTDYRTSNINERIVFPNPDVPIGQRTGLMVVKT
ncbi:MAG: succinylglutamate desuccinylase [Candidatus Azotimanducaceae bacterium]|jgi:succinylglutamate desuccinylase